MKKVILFGASGNLGREIAKELVANNYELTVVVRDQDKAHKLGLISARQIVADACDALSLSCLCEGQDIVISALGKSVSPNDKSKASFREVDYLANCNILAEAKKARIKKFVYISALHSERYPHLEYFKVHHDFSQLLMSSGIDFSIIKPPAIFSGFMDMIEMARKGRLVTIGSGEKKTNPIFEGDLARICVEAISEKNAIIEAGGKFVYSRHELNDIIQRQANPRRRVHRVPLSLFKIGLPLVRLLDRNTYDKLAFFSEVIQQDTIAPRTGNKSFEEYVREKVEALT